MLLNVSDRPRFGVEPLRMSAPGGQRLLPTDCSVPGTVRICWGLSGCSRVSGGHGTRLEEAIAFFPRVSPDFSKVDP